MKSKTLLFAAIAAVLFITFTDADAQNKGGSDFCSGNNYSSSGKVTAKELREMTIAATGSLNVNGGKNGGIRIEGQDRSDVLIRACVQALGIDDESAQSNLKSMRIETGGTIRAEGAGDENWSVSYLILVPRSTDLNLTAQNGGISIEDVSGNMDFRTQNGGIHLSDLSGSVKGRTVNGGLHVELTGNSWKGSGLELETTNGGVHVSLAKNYAAHFETSTVNGGFHSNIAQLDLQKTSRNDRRPGGRVTADLNGGGAPIKLTTTNGGVHIGSDDGDDE